LHLLSVLTVLPPTYVSALSLHDALPICQQHQLEGGDPLTVQAGDALRVDELRADPQPGEEGGAHAGAALVEKLLEGAVGADGDRSEEHTSELQSRFDLVCRLLLEKKKKQ